MNVALQPCETVVLQEWLAHPDRAFESNSQKVPTEIAYTDDGKVLWGYEIPSNLPRYTHFKLGLDSVTPQSDWDDSRLACTTTSSNVPHDRSSDRRAANLSDETDKAADILTAEYLKMLHKHLMEHLERRVGRTIIITPIDFVLTVPAT